jgi:uncharacterized protein
VNCPVCSEPLIVVERQQIELDYCLWCRGLWFDAGELALLAETLGRPPTLPEGVVLGEGETAERPRPCPRCDAAMEKVAMGTTPRVVVDRCRKEHGLWFDHGELGALLGQMGGGEVGAVIHFMGESIGRTEGNAAGAAGQEEGDQ